MYATGAFGFVFFFCALQKRKGMKRKTNQFHHDLLKTLSLFEHINVRIEEKSSLLSI